MNLANARFKEGCSGLNFDILAREPFWRLAWTTITVPDTVWAMCSMCMRDQTAPLEAVSGQTAERVTEEAWSPQMSRGIYLERQLVLLQRMSLSAEKGEKMSMASSCIFENLTYVPIDPDMGLIQSDDRRKKDT